MDVTQIRRCVAGGTDPAQAYLQLAPATQTTTQLAAGVRALRASLEGGEGADRDVVLGQYRLDPLCLDDRLQLFLLLAQRLHGRLAASTLALLGCLGQRGADGGRRGTATR